MAYQDENAYKNGLNNRSFEEDGPGPDILFERGKAFLGRVLFVFTIIAIFAVSQVTGAKNVDYSGFSGIFRAFAIKNSHFLDVFKNNILTIETYKVLIIIALALLAICVLINSGTPEREKRFLLKKIKLEKEIPTDRRLSFEEDEATKKIRKLENGRRALNIFLFFVTIIDIIIFVVIFALSGFPYVIREMSKAEIDRTIGDFRLIMNLISSFCQTIAVCGGVAILPFVMRNRTILSDLILKIFTALSGFATLHFVYFFFGHFTSYPSIIDFCFAVICGAMAGFAVLSIATEKKKKVLREFSNSKFNLY